MSIGERSGCEGVSRLLDSNRGFEVKYPRGQGQRSHGSGVKGKLHPRWRPGDVTRWWSPNPTIILPNSLPGQALILYKPRGWHGEVSVPTRQTLLPVNQDTKRIYGDSSIARSPGYCLERSFPPERFRRFHGDPAGVRWPPRIYNSSSKTHYAATSDLSYILYHLGRPRGCGGVVVRLLASHLGELGLIPGEVNSGFSYVGIVLDDAAGRWVFFVSLGYPASFALAFRSCSIPTSLHPHRLSIARSSEAAPLHSDASLSSARFTLVGSQDLDAKSRSTSPRYGEHSPLSLSVGSIADVCQHSPSGASPAASEVLRHTSQEQSPDCCYIRPAFYCHLSHRF
ncbi:hypothetical protein PR048_004828 [Dryococelus australis]|uniref:Uncharacterized protein n=1 Tax=Dryococelus australis TaxID=614101 RepID=A0ABQ9I6H4_9NEOP|nr:hypothetical protein PR048_004828 [Dryococelus australis]